VQRAWIEEQVPQCGYCQPGFIMATAALLRANPRPTDREIDEALTNICRCGTYAALRRAVHRAAALLGGS
jgi:isoquinoline 1-oxidoreductase alpha subunit